MRAMVSTFLHIDRLCACVCALNRFIHIQKQVYSSLVVVLLYFCAGVKNPRGAVSRRDARGLAYILYYYIKDITEEIYARALGN